MTKRKSDKEWDLRFPMCGAECEYLGEPVANEQENWAAAVGASVKSVRQRMRTGEAEVSR